MNTTIRARSSKSPSGPWQEIALPVPPGDLANPSTYVHENGTVTMIVHTCAVEPPGGWLNPTSIKCFSILRAPHWSGPWRTIAQNFLDVPLHCSRNRTDPAYQCACHIEVRRHPRALPAALALTGCSEPDSGMLVQYSGPHHLVRQADEPLARPHAPVPFRHQERDLREHAGPLQICRRL